MLRRRRRPGAGVLSGGEPGPALVLIDRTAGTNIGDMTENGGLTAAFDGITSQSGTACARKSSATTAFVGKTLVSPKVFGQAAAYGANNSGFLATNSEVTLNIRGKDGAAPSGPTDGTIIGTLTFTDTGNESAGRTIDSSDLVNTWDHLFLETATAGADNCFVAELVLYEWA